MSERDFGQGRHDLLRDPRRPVRAAGGTLVASPVLVVHWHDVVGDPTFGDAGSTDNRDETWLQERVPSRKRGGEDAGTLLGGPHGPPPANLETRPDPSEFAEFGPAGPGFRTKPASGAPRIAPWWPSRPFPYLHPSGKPTLWAALRHSPTKARPAPCRLRFRRSPRTSPGSREGSLVGRPRPAPSAPSSHPVRVSSIFETPDQRQLWLALRPMIRYYHSSTTPVTRQITDLQIRGAAP